VAGGNERDVPEGLTDEFRILVTDGDGEGVVWVDDDVPQGGAVGFAALEVFDELREGFVQGVLSLVRVRAGWLRFRASGGG